MVKRIISPTGEIHDYYNSYMNLGEGYIVDLVLATRISLRFKEPLWLCIQGAPSSGKTEVLNMLKDNPKCHFLYDITGKTLFSGANGAEGGYIPREVKDEGILIFPDFTTVLSGPKYTQSNIMSQLRVIHDGDASRLTGIDTNRKIPWSGKVGVLLAVTDAIEGFKKKASSLGERFLYYRHDVPEFNPIDYKKPSIPLEFPKEELVKNIDMMNKVDLPGLSDDWYIKIKCAAYWIARGRRAVHRDSRTKEIIQIFPPEEPYRLIEQFSTLIRSLILVHTHYNERTDDIFRHVVYSCIPIDRITIISSTFHSKDCSVNKGYLNEFLPYSKSKIHILLEDMVKLDLIVKKEDKYYLELTFGTLMEKWLTSSTVFEKVNG